MGTPVSSLERPGPPLVHVLLGRVTGALFAGACGREAGGAADQCAGGDPDGDRDPGPLQAAAGPPEQHGEDESSAGGGEALSAPLASGRYTDAYLYAAG